MNLLLVLNFFLVHQVLSTCDTSSPCLTIRACPHLRHIQTQLRGYTVHTRVLLLHADTHTHTPATKLKSDWSFWQVRALPARGDRSPILHELPEVLRRRRRPLLLPRPPRTGEKSRRRQLVHYFTLYNVHVPVLVQVHKNHVSRCDHM